MNIKEQKLFQAQYFTGLEITVKFLKKWMDKQIPIIIGNIHLDETYHKVKKKGRTYNT